MACANVGGGDWAMAAEVFRKYDADSSGRLDRDELLSALRDLDLLSNGMDRHELLSILREMDTNGDGVVSFEEFRAVYSRLAKVQAEGARQARLQRKPAPIPPNTATDPRLRAAFLHFASWGAAKGLAERAEKGDGINSRQFQRACAAAGLPIEKAAADVVFTVARKGSRVLSFPRFLEALAQVALEAGLALEAVLDAVRAAAPASATSPAKEVESKLPLSARSRRPKSPGACTAGSDLPPRPCSAAAAKPPTASPGSGKAGEATGKAAGPGAASTSGAAPLDKLNERFATLQQLLVAVGPEDGDTIPAAHMGQGVHGRGETGGHAAAGMQPAEPADDSLLTNPTYQLTQGQEAGDLGAFKLGMLTLLDQRCEAAEARCQALVATRAEMSRQLVSQVATAMGHGSSAAAQEEVQAALWGYEARLAAVDTRINEAVRQVAGECQAAVTALEGRVEALRQGNEEAMRKVNEALLAIARRVGSLMVK